MKVGFFVPEKGVMVEVEEAQFAAGWVSIMSTQLSALWKSGKHRLPSPYWCAWEGKEVSVFSLDGLLPPEDVLNAAEAAAFWNRDDRFASCAGKDLGVERLFGYRSRRWDHDSSDGDGACSLYYAGGVPGREPWIFRLASQ